MQPNPAGYSGHRGRLADYCILTSDNPRHEDAQKIVDDALPGFQGSKTPYKVILNRYEAIRWALDHLQPGDTLVLAGKGHEDYQVLKDETIWFDEREIVRADAGPVPPILRKGSTIAMEPISLQLLARAAGDNAPHPGVVTQICTDTRQLTPGCLFVALQGERFDGHDFVPAALAGGRHCRGGPPPGRGPGKAADPGRGHPAGPFWPWRPVTGTSSRRCG